jgi:hypothetical protein
MNGALADKSSGSGTGSLKDPLSTRSAQFLGVCIIEFV